MSLKKFFIVVLGLLFIATISLELYGASNEWIRGAYLADFLVLGLAFVLYIIRRGLLSYVLKRIVETVFVMAIVVTITFILLRFLPGGPFDSEKALTAEVLANINAKYHLTDPLPVQFLTYVKNILNGDLGESYKYIGRSVTDIIGESLPVSLQLGTYALLLSFVIGIPLGVYAAAKHNTWIDTTAMVAAMSGVALPSFLVAPILILIFAFWLDILPPALWDGPIYYILPVVTLGIRPAAIIARLTRSSVLEVIHSDYIRTARAKGLAATRVLFKHVLRNSLIPVLTISGPLVANLLSGSFVIEVIYAIPGIGRHFVQSVTNRDYPLIMGVTLVYALLLIVSNLVVDMLYAVVDPRIKLS